MRQCFRKICPNIISDSPSILMIEYKTFEKILILHFFFKFYHDVVHSLAFTLDSKGIIKFKKRVFEMRDDPSFQKPGEEYFLQYSLN